MGRARQDGRPNVVNGGRVALLHGGSRGGKDLYEADAYVTRTESGFATSIMRFSARTAIATSPYGAARLRARSVDPIRCL